MGAEALTAFLAAADANTRAAWADADALARRLAAAEDAVAMGWPGDVDASRLAAAIARASPEPPSADDSGQPFPGLAVEDLYLAASCAEGERAALREFELRFGPDLDRAIARSPTLGMSAAEFRQLVAVRLFVGSEPDATPKIASYRGRGSLKAWVRVTVSRLIVDLSRRRASAGRDLPLGEGLLERMHDDRDAEFAYLRETCGPMLEQAFGEAIDALSVRQRNLLRQRYLHGVSSDALAGLYGVHRSTVFVWLEGARSSVLEETRRKLAAVLPDHRLESVLEFLGSELELSIRRVLDSGLEGDTP